MRSRQSSAKWLLMITCLVMALCLIQRAVVLHHTLAVATLSQTSADVPHSSVANDTTGPQPCQLSAWSLLCAQPLFFDGALPALFAFLVLITVFTVLHKETFRDKPVPIPLLKIHLKNCVFRE